MLTIQRIMRFFIFLIFMENLETSYRLATVYKGDCNDKHKALLHQMGNYLPLQIIFICKMSTTPLKASFSAQKSGIQNSTAAHYAYFSQKSPIPDSPDPNQEASAPRDNSETLKTKLEVLLRQNSQLLNENAQLSELVNALRSEVEIRTRREETQFAKVNRQMGTVMVELKGQQQAHQGQLQRLLDEIARLHDECHRVQMEKTTQLRRQQEIHERQMVRQIAQIKKSQDDGKHLMELQLSKLRESLEMKDFEYESLKTQMNSQVESLRSQFKLQQTQLDHQKKLKEMEITEVTRKNKDEMRSALKSLQLQKNVQIRQYQIRLTKLKKDLIGKDAEIDQQSKKTNGENESIFLQLSSAKQEKQYLLEEIQTLTQSSQQKIVRQKERITQMAELEKENLESLFKSERESLIAQKDKLILLCNQKSQQIRCLYQNIARMRETADTERIQLKSLVEGLRERLKKTNQSNIEQIEALKIKMAQLHHCDVQALSSFYENQIAALHQEINTQREAHEVDREKLYNLLEDNDSLRKNFQVQISKQKAKIQDMKVKYAAARLEFKEQITSLGTKMQLTSQSLVRETDQKQKGAEFFQAEKRKFYQLIDAKDRQIQNLIDTTTRIKQLADEEITQMKSQISMLRDSLIAKDQQFKDLKVTLEQQYQRKSMKLIADSKTVHPDEELEKELHQIKGKLTEVQKDNFKKQKDIEHFTRQNKSLMQQLGLKAGFIQTMQMQSCAAIQDEKSKAKILMGKNQVSMKEYYQQKIGSISLDNQNLKKRLHEKESDLKGVVTKYSHLERKLRELLQAQQKLADFQNKIIHLGLDQNLVKNMGELFRAQ